MTLEIGPQAFADRRQFLTFRLGGSIRGLEGPRIVRVAEIHHMTPLPSDLRCNLGLVTHHGVVAGLMDLELLERQSANPRNNNAETGATQDPNLAASRTVQPNLPSRKPVKIPFHCIFARFSGGVAGFAIDELLGLEMVPTPSETLDSEESQQLPFKIVDLDALEIFL